MTKLLLAAACALLLPGCAPSTPATATQQSAAATSAPPVVTVAHANGAPAEIPAVITLPSAVGEITFLHELHLKDRAIPCVQCHHQINAKKLDTPHPEYLASSAVKCTICHDGAGKKERKVVYTCSACHHASPADVADETLSAKVVIHEQCWKCHAVATGPDASKSCGLCHSGKKSL